MSLDPIDRLILFGATGDLAGRFILPAVARLLEAGEVPGSFEVVASSRSGSRLGQPGPALG